MQKKGRLCLMPSIKIWSLPNKRCKSEGYNKLTCNTCRSGKLWYHTIFGYHTCETIYVVNLIKTSNLTLLSLWQLSNVTSPFILGENVQYILADVHTCKQHFLIFLPELKHIIFLKFLLLGMPHTIGSEKIKDLLNTRLQT